MRCKRCKLYSYSVNASGGYLCDLCSRMVLRTAFIGYGRTIHMEVMNRSAKTGKPSHTRRYVPAQVEDAKDHFLDAMTGTRPVLNTWDDLEVWRRSGVNTYDDYVAFMEEADGIYRKPQPKDEK